MANKTTEVQIKPAKGRPMLTWVGKRPLRNVIAYPAQLTETFRTATDISLLSGGVCWSEWPKLFPHSGLLFHGDNKDVLAYLLANGFRGKVKLTYIDPPFDSGADYVRRVELRGKEQKIRLEGEGYAIDEQLQYSDIWANDSFLQFMYERILLLKELLSEDGSIYLHCDYHRSHYLRCILDEVFGSDHFRNEITWVRSTNPKGSQHASTKFDIFTDSILYYTKSEAGLLYLDRVRTMLSKEDLEKKYHRRDEKGPYYDGPIICSASMGLRPNLVYEYKGYTPPPYGWRVKREILEAIDAAGDLGWSSTGQPFRKLRPETDKGNPIGNFWNDISLVNSQADERIGYPTQKPEALIERILEASSNPGDLILDCFIGSGTTAVAAQRLGRKWIGADINKGAIQTTIKRLQALLRQQSMGPSTRQQGLPGLEEEEPPYPAQLSFVTYRVNDYDLQIQHNEAFNLAVEHLGMTRTKTDSFFDGTLGKRLVKIIPFNHPLTPLDLEEIKNELSNRPEESRDIVVVCLGKELAVDGWLEDWNRLRRQGDFPNKIEVIELRTDPKVGGFFVHEPDQAVVKFERQEGKVCVTVENFLSPTIIQRLEQQSAGPLLKPQITDWRSMVDSIMIDANYDGQVFNITLSDVPEKKSDLVTGKYTITVPSGAVVAIKITDMLGEEVLVCEKV